MDRIEVLCVLIEQIIQFTDIIRLATSVSGPGENKHRQRKEITNGPGEIPRQYILSPRLPCNLKGNVFHYIPHSIANCTL